ncbi:hypothetical protein Q3G72_006927 [Acer saccharum]|nr:hypothetical protein Q3G72_006927 [Acer saccharum]
MVATQYSDPNDLRCIHVITLLFRYYQDHDPLNSVADNRSPIILPAKRCGIRMVYESELENFEEFPAGSNIFEHSHGDVCDTPDVRTLVPMSDLSPPAAGVRTTEGSVPAAAGAAHGSVPITAAGVHTIEGSVPIAAGAAHGRRPVRVRFVSSTQTVGHDTERRSPVREAAPDQLESRLAELTSAMESLREEVRKSETERKEREKVRDKQHLELVRLIQQLQGTSAPMHTDDPLPYQTPVVTPRQGLSRQMDSAAHPVAPPYPEQDTVGGVLAVDAQTEQDTVGASDGVQTEQLEQVIAKLTDVGAHIEQVPVGPVVIGAQSTQDSAGASASGAQS